MPAIAIAVLTLFAGCGARSPLRTPESQGDPGDAGVTAPDPSDPSVDASVGPVPVPGSDGGAPPDARAIDPLPPDAGGTVPIDPGPRRSVVSAGWRHSCSLVGTAVVCWGHGASGQLGDGFGDRDAPVEVLGSQHYVEVSAGMQHTCARTIRGEVYCWGSNLVGQLGSRRSTTSVPTQVPGIIGALGVSAAGQHSCALLADHTATCWGHGAFGQLGNGERPSDSAPVPVVGLDRIVQIDAGWRHTCALRDDGTAWCWGYNSDVELGVHGVRDSTAPIQVPGVPPLEQISAGTYHSCGITRDGDAYCWGSTGPLPRAAGPFSPSRFRILGAVDQIAAGENGAVCGVTRGAELVCATLDGMVACPADRECSPLGRIASGAHRVSTGFAHLCATLAGGGVICAGEDAFGQLGDGPSRAEPGPVSVLGL